MEGTPEVGAHALEERFRALEARLTELEDAPGGGGGEAGVSVIEEWAVFYIIDNGSNQQRNGAAANTPIAVTIDPDRFIGAVIYDEDGPSITDITENASFPDATHIQFDIDTTGQVIQVLIAG